MSEYDLTKEEEEVRINTCNKFLKKLHNFCEKEGLYIHDDFFGGTRIVNKNGEKLELISLIKDDYNVNMTSYLPRYD